MTRKPLLMETTEISAERSASEISSCLIQAGATQIACDYQDGKITGLRWTMRIAGHDKLFSMPARVEAVYKIFLNRAQRSTRYYDAPKLRTKAERVAWRQLLRWVQAQLAMIETGMVEAKEVFFPYWQPTGEKTIYQLFAEREFKALPAPENDVN